MAFVIGAAIVEGLVLGGVIGGTVVLVGGTIAVIVDGVNKHNQEMERIKNLREQTVKKLKNQRQKEIHKHKAELQILVSH